MPQFNAANERIKREYFTYLKEAKRFSEASLDPVAAAVARFERYTRYRDFKGFHRQQAIGFKQQLALQVNDRTKERLSKATLYSTLNALKNFFFWLAGRPGYRRRLSYADAEYFNLSEKEARVAKARRDQRVPTLEQIRHVIELMPTETAVQRRDRALVSFIALTGARDAAVASLKLKHVDLSARCVVHDAREVRTKFSKTFTTFFFPVGDEIAQVVDGWIAELVSVHMWGPDDPLFPATLVAQNQNRYFEAAGLSRRHWSNASPIRKVFRDAFTRAELPHANPHSFRKTLVQLGQRICKTPEAMKAWSQNLGHEGVLTTFTSYGEVARDRQAELIRAMSGADNDNTDEAVRVLMEAARKIAGRS